MRQFKHVCRRRAAIAFHAGACPIVERRRPAGERLSRWPFALRRGERRSRSAYLASSRSCKARHITLPVADFGSASTNSTCLGTL